jgi:hypothetical protein
VKGVAGGAVAGSGRAERRAARDRRALPDGRRRQRQERHAPAAAAERDRAARRGAPGEGDAAGAWGSGQAGGDVDTAVRARREGGVGREGERGEDGGEEEQVPQARRARRRRGQARVIFYEVVAR